MSGREIEGGSIFIHHLDPERQREIDRAAALHIADRVAAEHPHPLDDGRPQLAGQAIARDPAVRDGLLQLLDAIGLLEADAAAKTVNTRLKGGQP